MYIGIDIGGTKTLVATADSKLTLKKSQKFATEPDAMGEIDNIIKLIDELSPRNLRAIGIATPGPIDFQRGRILNAPNLPWHETSLTDYFRRRYQVPVRLENDANAAALAEYHLGAGHGSDPMLYVTISTGIGTGLIINGQVYHGAHDTEGGHITLQPNGPLCGCGGHGHFEAIASGTAIKRRFGRFGYQIKDKPTWRLIARDIAHGLATIATVTSPQTIVLGGGVSVHWDRFKTPLREQFADFWGSMYPPPTIKPAQHVETAAIFGAFLVADQAYKASKS